RNDPQRDELCVRGRCAQRLQSGAARSEEIGKSRAGPAASSEGRRGDRVKFRDAGEGAIIRRIRGRFAERASELPVGIGDDAAVLNIPQGDSVVFCSDLVAENTHFIRGLHPADSIGYKAIAANVSDVAAMAGIPMHFLISLAAPGELDWAWLDSFLQG